MSSDRIQQQPLISVIIPCYNQGRFLSKAIDSVLEQNYQQFEIIVVDDGSTDNTRDVARRYSAVKYVYQSNQGLSAARNTGIDHASGEYMVFVDSDDWLFTDALQINLEQLLNEPEAYFVSGAFMNLSKYGTSEIKKLVESDHYCQLLRGNYISMHAAVMYRREAFDSVRYDTTLKSCEDYDVYLKIARNHRVIHHSKLIAVYYHHETNMSGNMPVMLESAIKVLNRQKQFVRSEAEAECLRAGIEHWRSHYGVNIYSKLIQTPSGKNKNKDNEIKALYTYKKYLYFKYHIVKPMMPVKQLVIRRSPVLSRWLHKIGLYENFSPAPGKIIMGDFNRMTPYSKRFGYDRGGPVDRYYIENFLQKRSSFIRGRVLEAGDNDYTKRFGGSKVTRSDVLHIEEGNPKATIVADLSNAPHLPDNSFDCIVLTQTLHLIYDYEDALRTCYRVLKPGGTLLLTVPGISHLDHGEWKKEWLWSFTESSISKMLEETFPQAKTCIETFGNVLVASAFLYGLGLPELKKEQMDHADERFQLIITAYAIKPH